MKRWRFIGFVPLALLLVFFVYDLSSERVPPIKNQFGQSKSSKTYRTKAFKTIPDRLLDGRVSIVPLYRIGDLPSRTQAKTEKELPPSTKINPSGNKSKVRPHPRKTKQGKQTTRSSPSTPNPQIPQGNQEGDRPTLIASYDQIGFDRYLDIIESVGRFFVLLNRNGETKIGPPVSLLLRSTLPLEKHPGKGLAKTRPHLVSDVKVQQRLTTMRLPTNAYSDRVALLFTEKFDRSLWAGVTKALQREKISLPQVLEVNGHYVRGLKGYFLKFDTARLRHNRGYIRLNDAVRVKL